MATANALHENPSDLPPALRAAQEALHHQGVQATLRGPSECNRGIVMPQRHDEQTGDFKVLPAGVMQMAAGLEVSFQPTTNVVGQPDRLLTDGWCRRGGASTPISACEMVREEHPDGRLRYGKHKMIGSN